MKFVQAVALTGAIVFGAGGANAATVWATGVDYTPGSGILDSARATAENALGATDGDFLSLGIGGSALFTFGTTFTTPIAVIEFNLNKVNGYYEAVNVFGILGDAAPVWLGLVVNKFAQAVDGGFTLTGDFGTFDKLLLVDASQNKRGRDGFDIASISVTTAPSPVPLPAAGLLLAGAMGGFAALRRRKQNRKHD